MTDDGRVSTVKYGGSSRERQQYDDVFDDDDSNRIAFEHTYECLGYLRGVTQLNCVNVSVYNNDYVVACLYASSNR